MRAFRMPSGRGSGEDGICAVPSPAGLLGSQQNNAQRKNHRWLLWGIVGISFVTYMGSLGTAVIEHERPGSERTMIGTNDESQVETVHPPRHHLTEAFFSTPAGERWNTTVSLVEQSELGDTIVVSTRLIDHDLADNPEDTDDRGAVAVALCQDVASFFTPQNAHYLDAESPNISVRVQELSGATLATNRAPGSSTMECEEH